MKCNSRHNQDPAPESLWSSSFPLQGSRRSPPSVCPGSLFTTFRLIVAVCVMPRFYGCFLHGEPNHLIGSYFVIPRNRSGCCTFFYIKTREGQKKDFCSLVVIESLSLYIGFSLIHKHVCSQNQMPHASCIYAAFPSVA